MNAIGLDLGSTTLSALVVEEESGEVLASRCIPGNAELDPDVPGGYLQDPKVLLKRSLELVEELKNDYGPIGSIGIDGQMHGMLYLDGAGEPVSPFYTWQDGRGALPYGGASYAARLSRESGHNMATGFGLTTHYWHVANGLVPKDARQISTIYDYVAMKLCGRSRPLLHSSSAASLGLFDREKGCWDQGALKRAGLDQGLLPEVSDLPQTLGETKGGIPVGLTLGDNQASFVGSVREMEKSVLVNMGTGGQVSMLAGAGSGPDIETRPLGEGAALWVGSSLCGGKSYALLKGFLESCGATWDYEQMNALGLEALNARDPWTADTRYEGSRRQPGLRGSFGGISRHNFDAAHMIGAVLTGMAGGLHELYAQMLAAGGRAPSLLIGSGNAIRKNPALKAAFQQVFGLEMFIPAHLEEAAYGAALFGMVCSGRKEDLSAAQRLITYQ